MKKCIYIYLVFCCMLLCFGCSREIAEEADTLVVALGPKTAVEAILSHPVTFVYPDIEKKTRKILHRPSEEVITKADLLTITEFIMPDASAAMPFLDLQWYRNLERVSLCRCGVKSLEGVEKLERLTDLNLRGNQITDIAPLYNLNKLTSLNLRENEIPEEEEFEAFYERIMEINEETGQLETVSEEYIFWGVHTWEEKLYIDASSELGKQIAEDRMKYF